MAATFAWMEREVDPAVTVSQVKNRYFYLSQGQVFDATEHSMLEQVAKKKLEGGILDNMGVHPERDIPNL